jgi:putative hydrolase of the HAD superfamily
MALRAVLFDLDETLTDRGQSIDQFVPRFIEHFKNQLIRHDFETIRLAIAEGDGGGYATRESLAQVLRQTLPWRLTPTTEDLIAFWRQTFPRCNVERHGVTPTLRRLGQMGQKLGVISNGMIGSQYVKLETMRIRSLFSAILISEEVGISKPDPRIFHLALEGLQVTASEAIFVGDNPVLDIAGASAVGIRGVWLNSEGKPTPPEIAAADQVSSIPQVVELVQRITAIPNPNSRT